VCGEGAIFQKAREKPRLSKSKEKTSPLKKQGKNLASPKASKFRSEEQIRWIVF
jgi:hypothetical protein